MFYSKTGHKKSRFQMVVGFGLPLLTAVKGIIAGFLIRIGQGTGKMVPAMANEVEGSGLMPSGSRNWQMKWFWEYLSPKNEQRKTAKFAAFKIIQKTGI